MELQKYWEKGLVTLPCNIYYMEKNKRWNKVPSYKEWPKLTLEECKKLDYKNGVGIITGLKNDILVVDVDVKDDGVKCWNEMLKKHGEIDTPIVKTPTGGFHYYFKYNHDFHMMNRTRALIYNGKKIGVDIRSDNGFVVCPKSKQGNKKYKWINKFSREKLKEIPKWFFQYINRNSSENFYEDEDMDETLKNALTLTEQYVALFFKCYCKDKFVCVSKDSGKAEIYFFDGIRWKNKNGEKKIYQFITNYILDTIILKKYYEETKDNDTKQKLLKLNLKCRSHKFFSNVFKYLTLELYDCDFFNKLDTDIRFIGFENGAYDLQEHKFYKKGDCKPEWYISKSTGYDYENIEINNEMVSVIKDMFENEDDYDFCLRYICSCLDGMNKQEVFGIWQGMGRNGKSLLRDLIDGAFGEYSGTLSLNYLCNNERKADAPNPEIVALKGVRFCSVDETDEKMKVISSKLKAISGNDKIKARALRSNDYVEYRPFFKLTFLCNTIPSFTTYEQAEIKRTLAFNFPFTFTNNPNGKFEKKINENLKFKLKDWFSSFMVLLLNVHQNQYKDIGLKLSKNAEKFKDDLISEIDIFSSFINNICDKTDKKDDLIEISDLYDLYKDSEFYSGENKISFGRVIKRKFKNNYKIGHSRKSLLFGYKLKDDSDDDNNDFSLFD